MSTATDVSKKGFDYETGHGLVNCYRAVKEALRRKAVREGRDAKRFEGRETGDTLDIPAVVKQLQPQLRVGFVQAKGEAARVGVKKGDILVSYNGDPITNQESLLNAKKKADDANLAKVPVVLRRAEEKMTVEFASGPLGLVPVVEFAAAVFE
jgi:membrane-associated protease RseP (regulator of RpoE activity)